MFYKIKNIIVEKTVVAYGLSYLLATYDVFKWFKKYLNEYNVSRVKKEKI